MQRPQQRAQHGGPIARAAAGPLPSLQVKCSLLVLDLPNSEELVCSLFSTLLDVIKWVPSLVLCTRDWLCGSAVLPLPRRCVTARRRPACARSEDTAAVLEGTALELLRCMLEEADDIPQSQLDVLLARLLPGHAAEAPASAAAAAALLQRAETVVQPYVQKLLTALLLGSRTDSELKDDYHSLFFVVRVLGAGLVGLPCGWQALPHLSAAARRVLQIAGP